MNLDVSPEEELFRDEVRAFLTGRMTPELRAGARATTGVFVEPRIGLGWQQILRDQGWLAYSWPTAYGGPGWTPIQRYIFEKECALAGAPALPVMGLKLVGPVIYTFGSSEQKTRFLPGILSGEDFWAQGFSEPGAGSDLARLTTRAVRDGDRYLVNGTKVWTTQAQFANWIFCLARTDPDVPPQQGISFLLVPMNQPGVTVRPIISSSGDHEVNEVFFDDAIALVADRVGREGQGWSIAKFLLENERGGSCFAPKLLADIGQLESLLDACDPTEKARFRDRLDRVRLEAEALEITELRILANLANGKEPGPTSLFVKLIASEVRQSIDELVVDLHGYAGLELPDRDGAELALPLADSSVAARTAAARYLNSRAWTIFGGTSEIQLNIVSKAVLGL